MMSLQAREAFPFHPAPTHPLRAYAPDSPRAKARLIVLALLADGRLDERELETLDRRGVFAALGITREDFVQVLYDFCGDVAERLPVGTGSYRLSPAALAGLFDEVTDAAGRDTLLKLIFAVISSDGQLSDAEENVYWSAIDAWKPQVKKSSRTAMPGLYYG
jgi:hypothetical protein